MRQSTRKKVQTQQYGTFLEENYEEEDSPDDIEELEELLEELEMVVPNVYLHFFDSNNVEDISFWSVFFCNALRQSDIDRVMVERLYNSWMALLEGDGICQGWEPNR